MCVTSCASLNLARVSAQTGPKDPSATFAGAIDTWCKGMKLAACGLLTFFYVNTQGFFCEGDAAMVQIWAGFAEGLQSPTGCPGIANSTLEVIPVPFNSRTQIHQLQLGGMGAHVSHHTSHPDVAKQFAVRFGRRLCAPTLIYVAALSFRLHSGPRSSKRCGQKLAAAPCDRASLWSVLLLAQRHISCRLCWQDSSFWFDANNKFSKANAAVFQSMPFLKDFYRIAECQLQQLLRHRSATSFACLCLH
jgi:hypothetical protein